jgi:hypothetical protein
VGKVLELKKYISDGGRRFELKEVHYRAQLESQKRGSSTYFRSQKGVVQAMEKGLCMAISPFKKQKSPADTILLRHGLLLSQLRASTSAPGRQGCIQIILSIIFCVVRAQAL